MAEGAPTLENAPKVNNASKEKNVLPIFVLSNIHISQDLVSYFEQIGDAFFHISHVRALYAKHCCQLPHEFII